MTQNEQIKNLIISNRGMIQTSQVIGLGICICIIDGKWMLS